MKYSSIVSWEALIIDGDNLGKKFLVQSQIGDGCLKPTVSKFALSFQNNSVISIKNIYLIIQYKLLLKITPWHDYYKTCFKNFNWKCKIQKPDWCQICLLRPKRVPAEGSFPTVFSTQYFREHFLFKFKQIKNMDLSGFKRKINCHYIKSLKNKQVANNNFFIFFIFYFEAKQFPN